MLCFSIDSKKKKNPPEKCLFKATFKSWEDSRSSSVATQALTHYVGLFAMLI